MLGHVRVERTATQLRLVSVLKGHYANCTQVDQVTQHSASDNSCVMFPVAL